LAPQSVRSKQLLASFAQSCVNTKQVFLQKSSRGGRLKLRSASPGRDVSIALSNSPLPTAHLKSLREIPIRRSVEISTAKSHKLRSRFRA
jgi:hypothetical protein